MASSQTQSRPVQLRKLLSACIDCSRAAGKLIRSIREKGALQAKDKDKGGDDGSNGEVDEKDLKDPVTVADLEAQRLIEHALNYAFPGINTVGEEGTLDKPDVLFSPSIDLVKDTLPSVYDAVPPEDITIWIDPVDGTKSFILGKLDVVTCLIGISVRGCATAGVIHYPWREGGGKTVWGVRGHGVGGDIIASCLKTLSLPDRNVERPLGEVVTSGSAGNMIMKVVEGEVDVYFQTANNKWDTCAAEAILRAAGGNLTDFYGRQYFYDKNAKHRNSTGVLATLFDHETYLPRCGDEDDLVKACNDEFKK